MPLSYSIGQLGLRPLILLAVPRTTMSLMLAALLCGPLLQTGCGVGGGTATDLPPGPQSSEPPGDKVLYVALAKGNRVVAYRLGQDGLLPAEPFSSISVTNPRRLALAGGVLYAALFDRIVSLELGADGSLPLSPTAETTPLNGLLPLEMKVQDGTLYVAAALGQIEAFALDARGQVPADATSSTNRTISDYRTLDLANGFLYTAARATARIDTFILGPDGSLPADPEPQIPATVVGQPDDLVVQGGTLYVVDQSDDRLNAYDIKTNGLLPADPTSNTDSLERYVELLIDSDRLYASAYSLGRIDFYRLDPVDGSLPSGPPAAITFSDTSAFPLGLSLGDGVLYIAEAGLDRIDAYVLSADGSPPEFPSSSTSKIKGSFPSDTEIGSFP